MLTGSGFLLYFKVGRPAAQMANRYRASKQRDRALFNLKIAKYDQFKKVLTLAKN